MDVVKLNKVLKDLKNIELKRVSTFESDNFDREKNQGEEGERIDIYDLGEDDLFLQVITSSNSYGDEEGVKSIQFVKPITKTVKGYEPV